jgi:hypothetical protein
MLTINSELLLHERQKQEVEAELMPHVDGVSSEGSEMETMNQNRRNGKVNRRIELETKE